MKMHKRLGFTLLELSLVMALSIMVYSLISYITIQMNNSVRHTEAGYKRKKEVIEAAELIRWQLRSAYNQLPYGFDGKTVPSSNTSPASLRGAFLYGKRGTQANHAVLLFKTAYFPKKFTDPGTAEVGFTILDKKASGEGSIISSSFNTGSVDGTGKASDKKTLIGADSVQESSSSYLAYRQFPWADPLGLHEEIDFKDAPWQPLSYEVTGMNVEYSDDSNIWQQEWTEEKLPKWIRITLILRSGEPLVFIASPASASERWQ